MFRQQQARSQECAGRKPLVQRQWPWAEVIELSKEERAKQLVQELSRRLVDLEKLGALFAAAHLETAIDTLCKEFNIERDTSIPV